MINLGIRAARSSLLTRLPKYWQKVLSGAVATWGLLLAKILAEPGVGARSGANSAVDREAAPIFLEREAMLGGRNGAAGVGNVEACVRGVVALRGVERGEIRQVHFQAICLSLEGTSLCP